MAVDVTPQRTYYRQSTGLSLPVTVCGWFRFDNTPAAYRTLHVQGRNNYSAHVGLFRNSSGQLVVSDNTGDKIVSGAVSNSTWYFIAAVFQTGTNNLKLYYRTEGSTSLTSAQATLGAITYSNEQMVWCGGPASSPNQGTGEPATQCHDGGLAYGRVFASALSSADLLTESASATAVATEWADWPFAASASVTTDASGNSRTLTSAAAGSQADLTNPNISLGGTQALDGHADVAASASGSLGLALTISGHADAATGASGGLLLALPLASTAPAATEASGTLAVTRGLAGSAAASASATGDLSLTGQVDLAGMAPVASSAVGTLSLLGGRVDIAVQIGPTRTGWAVGATRSNRAP